MKDESQRYFFHWEQVRRELFRAIDMLDDEKLLADIHSRTEEYLEPLSLAEMESIEALAAQYREEVEGDPQAKRYILQLLNAEATLIENDEGRFADAHCILGQKVLPTDKHKRR